MKRFLALLILGCLLFGLCACSPGTKANVTVLWSGDSTAENSMLYTALAKSMRSENLACTHQYAQGDATNQLEQMQNALKNGCQAVMVDVADAVFAAQFVVLAKEANIPLFFFGTPIETDVLSTYDRAFFITPDSSTFGEVQGTLVKNTLKKKLKSYDRNGDEVISYVALGELGDTLMHVENNLKSVQPGSAADIRAQVQSLYATHTDERGDTVECLFTVDDAAADEALTMLQELGFNTNRKNRILLFTVIRGTSPLGNNTRDLIRSGKLFAATAEDSTLTAATICRVLRNCLNGEAPQNGVKDTVKVSGQQYAVPYITLT